tara:strand:+ start:353 stop:580 length:228 start_codon:yes stop_codon:yes gene_type:complete
MNQHTLLLFGPLRDEFGVSEMVIEMPENCDVGHLLVHLDIDSNLVKVAVNGAIVPVSTKLPMDSEIALLPPVSGG